MTVEVLSKPNCIQCDATYTLLNDGRIEYSSIDMSQDKEALLLARSLGFMSAPVVILRDGEGEIVDKWSGFRPEKIMGITN